MSQDDFAERLCQLAGEAEDAGLERPERIADRVELRFDEPRRTAATARRRCDSPRLPTRQRDQEPP